MNRSRGAGRLGLGPGPSRRTSVRTHRMLVLTILDQGASSVSNFALAVLVAHYSGARALGVFALVTSTYVIAQGLVRSFSSDCLLTRPETDDAVMARYERGGYLAATALAMVVSLVILAVCLSMTSDFALTFLIFGLSFPFLAMQDFSRYIGISRHDPGYAIRLDVAWFVLFVLAYLVLHAEGWVTMPWLFGAWTVTGGAVGLVTLGSHLGRDIRSLTGFWVRSERAVGSRFAGQFLITSVSNYLIFYLLVLFVISVSLVGVIRLAMLVLGPVTVLAAGVLTALVPLATRRFQSDRGSALRFLAMAGLGMAAVTALWTAMVYGAPVHSLTKTLGPTWPQARPLVPWTGLSFVMACILGGATAGLRALRAAKQNLRVALAVMPVAIGLPIAGAAVSGARGVVVTTAVAASVYAVAAWVVLLRVSATVRVAAGSGEGAEPEEAGPVGSAVFGQVEPGAISEPVLDEGTASQYLS